MMANLQYHLLLLVSILCFLTKTATATDRMSSSQYLFDDGSALISSGGKFELGFFSPGNSKYRYLGLWFKNIPVRTVVWVANRAAPINDTSGMFTIDKSTSNLAILSHNETVDVWSSNSSTKADDPILQILDSGNLVLRDAKDDESDPDTYLWQSFDYPSDKLIAGMKAGWDLRKGLNRRVTAWRSPDDPSPGEVSMELENPFPELMMRRNNSKKITRSGPWNGLRLSGGPVLQANQLYAYDFILNKDEAYYTYHLNEASVITMLVLNETGLYSRYLWIEAERDWRWYWSIPTDQCDNYGLCGANGVCLISESPVCRCLKGFEPKSPEKWRSLDWSDGCVRTVPLNCSTSRRDKFVTFPGLKVPDTMQTWFNQSMNLKECEAKCLNNCSCMAFSSTDIRGKGSGCVIWTGDLIDIRQFSNGGQDLYIRMPFSTSGDTTNNAKILLVAIIVPAVLIILGMMMLITGYCIHKRKRKLRGNTISYESELRGKENLELPVFDFETMVKATDNFSTENKLGEGGFGPVYKGILEDGQEIAVKRLAQSSGQGQNEFRNEVILISKLQHRNLVRMLGCCLEGAEKLLIYEYMSNKSLDKFIYDQTQGVLIDWPNRYRIICGIARGLLYLHQDSRLRIIHRDVKASNVLLDNDLNPKISDFGTARTFGGDQTEGSTNIIVGTYGYMAPEYAIDGAYSIKSDVFSFGILLLEIVSGKKNRSFYRRDSSLNLLGQAWELWESGNPLDLMDEILVESSNFVEVIRCIHIGLLCTQQRPEDRPSMSSVVVMLGSENELPQPKQPTLFDATSSSQIEAASSYSSSKQHYSANEVTVTALQPR